MELYRIKRLVFSLGHETLFRRLNWRSLSVVALIAGLSVAALVVQNISINLSGAKFERGSDEILGMQLGLDLAGGTHLVFQPSSADLIPTDDQMDGLVRIIRDRVDNLGVAEPNIQRLGDQRLLVQLPGIEDVERAKRLIGQTASLGIVERVCRDSNCLNFEDNTVLTGEDLSRSFASKATLTNEPLVAFELFSDAARRFAIVTQRIYDTNSSNSPDQLVFQLDGKDLVETTVRSPILSGNGQITGNFTSDETRDLAIQIESGRLPIDIEVITERVVAASLGGESLEDSLIAGLIGLALVFFFVCAYYRGAGFVAAIALVVYTLMVLAIFKLFPITLTLSGVAAFILSLGMAVDANVLIFERMKEEIRLGRTVPFALEVGFNRAWPSIRDGNVSTLLIAGVLFFFGNQTTNSSVSGFAVALAIGVLISMFTAIFMSRNLLYLLAISPIGRFARVFTPESLPSSKSGRG